MTKIYSFIRANWLFIIALTAYVIFVGITIYFHEIWEEEMHAWVFARDSHSLSELYSNLKYEGHPILWYVVLYLISRFFHSPVAMQVVHFGIAIALILVFIRNAPFSRLQKILFIFGYFPVFEYSVLARNYGIGVLLLFIYCSVYGGREKRLILLAMLLMLLAHTSLMGFIVAVVLGSVLGWEILVKRVKIPVNYLVGSGSIYVVGLYTAYLKLIPPQNYGYRLDWFMHFDIKRIAIVFLSFWRGMIPLPQWSVHYWNYNFFIPNFQKETSYVTNGIGELFATNLGSMLLLVVAGIISVLMIAYIFILFYSRRFILYIYAACSVMFYFLFYVVYWGYVRHYGFYFVMFIVCLWLFYYYPAAQIKSKLLARANFWAEQYKSLFISLLLFTHVLAGIFAGVMDWKYSFAGGKAVSEYIQTLNAKNLLLIGDIDDAMTPISGYTGEKFYFPRTGRSGTFIIADNNRTKNLTQDELLRRTDVYVGQKKQEGLLVLNYPLAFPIQSKCPVSLEKMFIHNVADFNDYYLYRVRKECR